MKTSSFEWLINGVLAIGCGCSLGWGYGFLFLFFALITEVGTNEYLTLPEPVSAVPLWSAIYRFIRDSVVLIFTIGVSVSVEWVIDWFGSMSQKLADAQAKSISTLKDSATKGASELHDGFSGNVANHEALAQGADTFNNMFWGLSAFQLAVLLFIAARVLYFAYVYLTSKK